MPIKLKKSLGQNFLVDPNIQRKIVSACGFQKSDSVLEIGSGSGIMTKLISEQVEFVYALEIDSGLCQILRNNLQERGNVRVIHQDILKMDLGSYFSGIKRRLKVFGNIPYYISSPIIEHMIKYRKKIEVIFMTAQKEFARRIVASAGSKEFGSLSCFAQYYMEPEIMFSISRNCFSPIPKVDSSFLKLLIRDTPAVETKDEGLLFSLIRAGFGQRRKTLRNSLSDFIKRQELECFFEKFGLDKNIRPEKLSLRDFSSLADYVYRLRC